MAKHNGIQFSLDSNCYPILVTKKEFLLPSETTDKIADIISSMQSHIAQLKQYYSQKSTAVAFNVIYLSVPSNINMPRFNLESATQLHDIQYNNLEDLILLCMRNLYTSIEIRSVAVLQITRTIHPLQYYMLRTKGYGNIIDYMMRHEDIIKNPNLYSILSVIYDEFVNKTLPKNIFSSMMKYEAEQETQTWGEYTNYPAVYYYANSSEKLKKTYDNHKNFRRSILVLNKLKSTMSDYKQSDKHVYLLTQLEKNLHIMTKSTSRLAANLVPELSLKEIIHDIPDSRSLLKYINKWDSYGVYSLSMLRDENVYLFDARRTYSSESLFSMPFISMIRKFIMYFYISEFNRGKNINSYTDDIDHWDLFLTFWLKLVENIVVRNNAFKHSNTPALLLFNLIQKKIASLIKRDETFLEIFNLTPEEYDSGSHNSLQLLLFPLFPRQYLHVYKLLLLHATYENINTMRTSITAINNSNIINDKMRNIMTQCIDIMSSTVIKIEEYHTNDNELHIAYDHKLQPLEPILFDEALDCPELVALDTVSIYAPRGEYKYIGALPDSWL